MVTMTRAITQAKYLAYGHGREQDRSERHKQHEVSLLSEAARELSQ
jgi:hypothetical protein